MVKLVEKGAFAEVELGAVGGVVLTEADIGGAWSVAPFRGQEAAVDAALRTGIGVGFPAPNTVSAARGVRAIWAGHGRALVIGADIPQGIQELAAVTLQGDGIAALMVAGPQTEAVLARLVPLDLRPARFPQGMTARSFVNHMTAQISRVGENAFEIMVMRSMARTLVHELREAAEMVAARPERTI